MIQRIQSLWLLLAAAFTAGSFKFSFFSGNQLNTTTNVKEFIRYTAQHNVWILILTVIISVTALVSIFMYKDRKRQSLIVLAAGILSVILIGLYFSIESNFTESSIDLTSLIHFSVPLFLALALRAIYKDEKLVKSADRIR
ncbi:MAG: DUF4293 domain-containing protein [Chitinophagaceae bacterium]|nr:DUF4293 domain-containing protein [Chitinophagaceae bacterium]